MAVNQVYGRETGLAFCDDKGVVQKSRDMNEILHELLLGEIFAEHPALFQADIQSIADIEDKCSMCRIQCMRGELACFDFKSNSSWGVEPRLILSPNYFFNSTVGTRQMRDLILIKNCMY
jgi:hypothetical protein